MDENEYMKKLSEIGDIIPAKKCELPVDNIVSRKDLCRMQIEMCADFIANDYPTINTFKNSSGEKIALKLARRMSKLVSLAENG